MYSIYGINAFDILHSGKGHDDNPPGRGGGRYPWGSGEKNKKNKLKKANEAIKKWSEVDYPIADKAMKFLEKTLIGIGVTGLSAYGAKKIADILKPIVIKKTNSLFNSVKNKIISEATKKENIKVANKLMENVLNENVIKETILTENILKENVQVENILKETFN